MGGIITRRDKPVALPPPGMIANPYAGFPMPGGDKNRYPVTRFLRLVI